MEVVLSREAAAPVVAVNIWYGVGSRNEREGRTGFAHLFEHMMFQGSKHVPEMGHFALIEKAGGSLNGSTWLDRTNYYETLPAHYLELGLWLESDRLGWLLPAMTQEKLDNQRDVVKNERRWRVDNQPYGDWDERIQALMYPPDHPYHHSVIGSMEDLDAASLEDVEQFFRTYYAPNNAVLTICGDFEPAQARELVAKHFGDLPRGPDIPPIPGRTTLEPTLGGEVRETVYQDVSLPRVYTSYRIPPFGTDEYYTALVTSYILGYGKAALLGRSAAEIERGITEQFERLRDVEDADVERAVSLLAAERLNELQRLDERADQLSMYTQLFDDPERINTEVDRIRAVTPQLVRDFAARYLGTDNRAVLTYVPREVGA